MERIKLYPCKNKNGNLNGFLSYVSNDIYGDRRRYQLLVHMRDFEGLKYEVTMDMGYIGIDDVYDWCMKNTTDPRIRFKWDDFIMEDTVLETRMYQGFPKKVLSVKREDKLVINPDTIDLDDWR